MSALMRRHHTKVVRLCLEIPAEREAEVMAEVDRLGLVTYKELPPDERMDWREAFPELKNNETGIMIRGSRTKEGITQRELAKLTGIPQRHISEMENGKRVIGKERAKKLAAALNVSYKIFL